MAWSCTNLLWKADRKDRCVCALDDVEINGYEENLKQLWNIEINFTAQKHDTVPNIDGIILKVQRLAFS